MSWDEIIQRLRPVLERGPALRLAILFGSTARGTDTNASDLDLAILPLDPSLSLEDELVLQSRLSSASGREVDLVRLDRATPLLRVRIATEGVPLLGHPLELSRFQAQAGIEHADLEPQRQHAVRLFLKRLSASRSTGSA